MKECSINEGDLNPTLDHWVWPVANQIWNSPYIFLAMWSVSCTFEIFLMFVSWTLHSSIPMLHLFIFYYPFSIPSLSIGPINALIQNVWCRGCEYMYWSMVKTFCLGHVGKRSKRWKFIPILNNYCQWHVFDTPCTQFNLAVGFWFVRIKN